MLYRDIEKILTAWNTTEYREYLNLIGAEELFDSLLILEQRSEQVFQKMESQIEGESHLEHIRSYRSDITNIVNETLE